MTDYELEIHLMRCEHALQDPEVRRDPARASAFLADDFLEVGASGSVWTRSSILERMAIEDFKPSAMEQFQCRRLAPTVALVRYQAVRSNPDTGQLFVTQRSSIWIGEAGVWRVRYHQGTKVAPPE